MGLNSRQKLRLNLASNTTWKARVQWKAGGLCDMAPRVGQRNSCVRNFTRSGGRFSRGPEAAVPLFHRLSKVGPAFLKRTGSSFGIWRQIYGGKSKLPPNSLYSWRFFFKKAISRLDFKELFTWIGYASSMQQRNASFGRWRVKAR